jgi:hypothetical protein
MSVVTRILGAKEYELYCKGSPEMITSLSRKETGNRMILYFITLLATSLVGKLFPLGILTYLSEMKTLPFRLAAALTILLHVIYFMAS